MQSDGNSFCGNVVLNGVYMHIGMKTALRKKLREANVFQLLLQRFKIFRVIEENAYLKKYSTIQQGTHKIGF